MDEKLQKNEHIRTITFTPPLYKQRYQFIKQLVSKYKPKKVADLGCAECRLLWMLKFCSCIEVLVGLDINEDVMKEKMHTLSPLPGDYLQPSERCLTVALYQGSIAHKDPCMLGFDMITCVEVIEHLEAKELEKFPEVVFGFMSPGRIIISTPNSEFNSFLPTVTLFRHPDHKFEWNRAQFQNWAQDAAARYDYTVEFTGLGAPPSGNDVGFCTQIGVFVRKYLKNDGPVKFEKDKEHVYKTVFKAVYPSLKDEKYLQNAVVNEVVRTAQIIVRRLLDHRKSEYKKCSESVETEPRFQPPRRCFRYLEYPPLTKADSKGMQPFINGNTVYIPLANIFSFPKVNQLCGTFETLCKLITGKVALSSDGSAVLMDAEYENEEQN
ncbi:small RNA 2'-O-methyltransferase isoform X2 [Rhineura floridana]|nr:small RNA 2'-O-methyltransferase isoform X2 [Rhineura floridana]XP_061489870.1 small RNA 2'-O-methyltransferase isoform X2 [Rhineura floridana]XP_061489871.1 small RNA 2'-O-methyltransferase isoform X2 [Rhineura floridana]XP_061489872.1 small RNA 2'-O-methyltransferase isoform X2 [Rhineura floridana]XP_061489873.1 small RNA 2'-O-methyltransferase isoform X2 [Rhineura floridana]XP_061489874.1 small RNA 2'-O-methyltransferase isoform X2 [Rhineura floridana]XP_061489875.1 small RNA 2'-O-methy